MTDVVAQCPVLCAVLDNFVESADQALSVLHHYNMLTECYIRSVLDPDVSEQEAVLAEEEWETCLQRQLAVNTAGSSGTTLYPSFSMVWSEIAALVPNPRTNAAALKRETNYHGLHRPVYETYMYEVLYNSQKYHTLLKNTLLNQPRYETQPEDSIVQLTARLSTKPDPLLGLTHALLPFLDDTVGLKNVLDMFGRIVFSVAYYWTSGRYLLDDNAGDYAAGLVEWYAEQIRDPFSNIPHYIRRALVQTNVEGCFHVLMVDAVQILEEAKQDDWVLGWRLHKRMVRYAMHLNTNSSNSIFEVLRDGLDWAKFLSVESKEEENWVNPAYRDTLEFLQDGHEQDRDALYEYPDTTYEPIDPPLKPSTLASSVRASEMNNTECPCCLEPLDPSARQIAFIPMKLRCPAGHCLHYQCMNQLINGVEEYSNLCPICRHKICEPRERRAVDAEPRSERLPRRVFSEDLYIGV
jgi:hypothetical protein